jgi:hypothetical protein
MTYDAKPPVSADPLTAIPALPRSNICALVECALGLDWVESHPIRVVNLGRANHLMMDTRQGHKLISSVSCFVVRGAKDRTHVFVWGTITKCAQSLAQLSAHSPTNSQWGHHKILRSSPHALLGVDEIQEARTPEMTGPRTMAFVMARVHESMINEDRTDKAEHQRDEQ